MITRTPLQSIPPRQFSSPSSLPGGTDRRYNRCSHTERDRPDATARQAFSSPGLAAWIVQPCGVDGIARATENADQAGTALANGADLLRRAVRDAAVEYQRLLEASQLELAPTPRHFGLDLIEPPHDIEHPCHRAIAVRPLDRKLTAVRLVDAGGNIDLHGGTLRQRLDRMVDDGLFINPGIRKISNRQFELAFVLSDRIDMRWTERPSTTW